jgi:hypothetical protein
VGRDDQTGDELREKVYIISLNEYLWCEFLCAGAEDFGSGPYLRPEIQVLRDLHLLAPSSSTGKSVQEEWKEREQAPDDTSDVPKRPLKPTGKPKPKWLKM